MPNRDTSSTALPRAGAWLVAAAAVAQTVLALVFLLVADGQPARDVHRIVGMSTILIAVFAAAVCYLRVRASHPTATLLSIALAVLSVIQVGLGEAHVQMIHMVLGTAFLAGAVWLVVDLSRRPARG